MEPWLPLEPEEDCEPLRLEGMPPLLLDCEPLAPGILGELLPGEPDDEAVGIEELLDPEDPELELELLELEREEEGLLGELLPEEPLEEELGIDELLLEELCCCSRQPVSNRPSNTAAAKGRTCKGLELFWVGIVVVSLFVTALGYRYG